MIYGPRDTRFEDRPNPTITKPTATSDVLGTGWFAADAANVKPGATDIVTERGEEDVARIKDLTNGIGADSVLECVGTQESMMQAIRSTRQVDR